MKNRTKFDMLKKKVGAKTDNQLIQAMVKMNYEYKLHEELRMVLLKEQSK